MMSPLGLAGRGSGSRPNRRPILVLFGAFFVVAFTLGPASSALAAGGTLRVSGPASNVMGQNFNYVISGIAPALANRVVVWEQDNKASGCAPTFAAESARALLDPTAMYGLTLRSNLAVSGSYSVTARFGAAQLGVHGMCAYLINLATGATYASSGAFWTNHTPVTTPTSVVPTTTGTATAATLWCGKVSDVITASSLSVWETGAYPENSTYVDVIPNIKVTVALLEAANTSAATETVTGASLCGEVLSADEDPPPVDLAKFASAMSDFLQASVLLHAGGGYPAGGSARLSLNSGITKLNAFLAAIGK
jgi:hypothetical protein